MTRPQAVDVAGFATQQLELLDKELNAELSESKALTSTHAPKALARAGLAILNLTIASQRTGLGGKTVVDLGLDSAIAGSESDLPRHGIRVGDIVRLAEQPKCGERKVEKDVVEKNGANGVVVKAGQSTVVVALDKDDVDVPSGKLWLVKLANDVTYKRMNQTMTRIQKMSEGEYSSLSRVLFGLSTPVSISPGDLGSKLELVDQSLNDSQRDAVRFALASHDIALIHGPPGTGKTHTLIELILQLVKRDLRVLVCGPSNISVDNIVERLAPHKLPIVRLGHPARLLPSVLNQSLEVLIKSSDASALVQDIRKEMDDKQASIRKTRNSRERKSIYGEIKDLRKEYRVRETNCVGELVRQSKVVLATLHGAGGFHLKNQTFDVVIIDEASQALEAACWIPILSSGASRLVIAGDHLQLPPTIKSNPKSDGGKAGKGESGYNLETTLFDRMLALHGSSIKRMLTTQYRMHENIMAFPSTALYESKLIAANAVKTRLLSDLPHVHDTDDTREPLVFIDTQGDDFAEQPEDEDDPSATPRKSLLGGSKSNELEAGLVKMHVKALVEAGLERDEVAVITPYNGQLAVLSALLKDEYAGVELGSIDGFQGTRIIGV